MKTKKKTTTAVILAAGRGSRMQRRSSEAVELTADMRRLADKGLKGLIPVAGRPFLDYNIRRLAGAGIDHVCFVISPTADEMRDYGDSIQDRFGVKVSYAVQQKPRGTADALLAAESVTGNDSFLLCNCDNLYPRQVLSDMVALPPNVCAVAGFDSEVLMKQGNYGRERIKSFALLRVGEGGRLIDIVEKPASTDEYKYQGKTWIGMNLYRFTTAVFGYCRRLEPHPRRGEMELTGAVVRMIESPKCRFRIIFASGPVFDLTGKDDILSVQGAVQNAGP